MKRTEPSRHLYTGRPYTPSWAVPPVSTVVPYLPGHRGLVGKLRDQMTRNTPEADK